MESEDSDNTQGLKDIYS